MAAGLLAAASLTLAGCADPAHSSAASGWLPQTPNGTSLTEQGDTVVSLWNGVWIAAWIVGGIVWGLMIYAMVRYRARKTDTGLPPQLRYNVPLELLYTVVPVLMVGVIFFYTARDESYLMDTSKTPDLTVEVVAKQWSWDFNYIDSNTYVAGVQTQLDHENGTPQNDQPVLYLPVNKSVEFDITSRDVDHSFWVPAFLEKMDAIPGKVNKFQVTPTQTGTFQGKCAELCGAYHSQMLFKVQVLSQSDYDAQIAKLKASGNVGKLPDSLSREPVPADEQSLLPKGAQS